ncbi:xanthine dehydrogenase family protein molybdopterin-binding subunit [Dehalococcoidia bacterium]|nr:xanthine dehydrogenase family protein molybdopterin-binding subunit [Dehalococcoidia bacterium]
MATQADVIFRPDLHRFAQGKGEYVDDIKLPEMCHAAFVRSPHAHAHIKRIVTDEAMKISGAIAVLTPEELLARTKTKGGGGFEPGPAYGKSTMWGGLYDKTALPNGTVYYVGEPLAVAIGETRYIAEDMVDAILVDYEPLTPVVDMDKALDPGTPLIHEQLTANMFFRREFEAGDTDKAFREADLILDKTFKWARQTNNPLETRGAIASYDNRTSRYTVWASAQGPHPIRSAVSGAFGLDEAAVRAICPDVGGSFGSKGGGGHIIALSHMAQKLGRPVKWIEDRREHMLEIHSRDHEIRISAAFKKDGQLLGIKVDAQMDAGAHSAAPSGVSTEPSMSVLCLPGPYKLENYDFDSRALVSNKAPYAAYRGVSKPLGPFVIERIMDMAAKALDMDPTEIRRRNYIQPHEFPYNQVQGWIYDSGDYPGTMDLAMELADYEGLRKEQAEARSRGEYVGIGVAAFLEPGSIGSRWYRERGVIGRQAFDAATVVMDQRGNIAVKVSGKSAGQSHETTFPRWVAKQLGVPAENVRFIQGDTDNTPFGTMAGNSRSAVSIGGAIFKALEDLKAKLILIGGLLLHIENEELEVSDGHVYVKGDHSRQVSFPEVAAAAYNRSQVLLLPETGIEPGLEFTRFNDPPATYANGFHIAMARVDVENGLVTVQKYFMVDDSGTMLDESTVAGQAIGSTITGISNALLEELVHDDQGQLLTSTLMDYLLPSSDLVPPIKHKQTETPSLLSLNGAKAAGESGNCGSPVAIANAISDALSPLGIEVNELPASPQRIYELIKAARSRKE